MDVSVIIVNYHSAQMVIDCIRSIFQKTSNITYEVIVVDNASEDGSVEKLERIFGTQIIVISSEKNLGFGKANNLGVTKARGKYLFLLNPDTILVNDAIQYLYDYMEQHPEVGVVGGNLYTPDMKPTPSFCQKYDDFQLEKERAAWRTILFGKVKQKIFSRKQGALICKDEFNHTDQAQKVAYIFGADMMIKKEVFEKVGGFDPDFFMYAEEQELSWRITEQGYYIMNIPQAKIIHLEGATIKDQNQFSDRQFKMRMNGTLIYYTKRFGLDGAEQFYKLRSLRYDRLIKIAKWQRKLTDTFVPVVQKRCLDEVYQEFMEQRK